MTNIERMAKEAGMHFTDYGTVSTKGAGSCLKVETLAKFAALVAEECAKECEGLWCIDGQFTADEFAAAIRAKYPMPKELK